MSFLAILSVLHIKLRSFVNSFEYCGPFIYSTLNKRLETWSCVCGYYAYGLFLSFRSLWNIPKNARELGVGCGQFPSGINGLIWTEVIFIQEVSGIYTLWFFAGGFWEALTNDHEGTGMEMDNSQYNSRTCTLFACILKRCKSRELEMFLFCLWNKFTVSIIHVRLRPVHTYPFSKENGAVLLRIQLSSRLQRRKRSPKAEPFENALQSGVIWKRCFLKTLFSSVDGENDQMLSENGYVIRLKFEESMSHTTKREITNIISTTSYKNCKWIWTYGGPITLCYLGGY